jgi:lipopolysaccharide transport system ATP-binding protein
MGAPAIRVEGVSKRYRIAAPEDRVDTFREALTRTLAAPRRLLGKARDRADAGHIWALDDVSFDVQPGDVVGIIGRNGAGKTTLLKVFSRITAPTRGRIEVRGRLASLLEVGTGFHPELTGRENIFVNGAILGMSRAEVRRRFDEIVAFAEVERFLDTPVKRYSSGMAVRLAFAIAAHLDPDVLLVDEVLSVGDAQFQRRCMGKLGEATSEGRTVLFVSHNTGAVSRLCSRGILLHRGQLVVDGTTAAALERHARELGAGTGWEPEDFFGGLNGTLEMKGIWINGQDARTHVLVRPSEPVTIRVRGDALRPLSGYRTTVSIFRDGQLLVSRHDAREPGELPRGTFESEVGLPAYFLSPGEYSVTFGGYSVDSGRWSWSRDHLRFLVIEEWSRDYDTIANMGLVNLPSTGRRQHLG